MNPDTEPNGQRHLQPEELDLLALDGAGDPPAQLLQHMEGCRRCRRELEELRALHSALCSLSLLGPRPGFAARVMERVVLPRPWYAQAWAALVERWMSIAAVLAAVGVSVGGMALWLARHPGLTPGALAGFVYDRLRVAFWRVTISAWRTVLESGLADAARSLVSEITLPEAALGLATLSLVAVGASVVLVRLMQESVGELAPAARGSAS